MPHRNIAAVSENGCRKIRVEDAVGTTLAHDITEIRPGEFKGPSFRKGHRVAREDLCHLMRLGKRHLYVLSLNENQIHEDDAVLEMATTLAGPGITFERRPREGKIQLKAVHDGLFKVDVTALIDFNLIPEVMCASVHTDTPVKKGQELAGTRAKELLNARGLPFEEVELNQSITSRSLTAFSGAHTTPQIFMDGKLIGGADDLQAYFN